MPAALSRAVRTDVTVSLGVISLQVALHGTKETETFGGLRNLCTHAGSIHQRKDPSPITRRDFCPVCDNDDKDTFVKGVVTGDTAALLTPEQMGQTAELVKKVHDEFALAVHRTEDVVGIFETGSSYYLNVKAGNVKNYHLLVKVLTRHPELTFLGEFANRTSAELYRLTVVGGRLVMQQMARPEVVREAPAIPDVEVPDALTDMACQFALMSVKDYDPEDYRNGRAALIAELIEAAQPTAVAGVPGQRRATPEVDLTAQLLAGLTALAEAADSSESAPVKTSKKPKRKAS